MAEFICKNCKAIYTTNTVTEEVSKDLVCICKSKEFKIKTTVPITK